MTDLPIPVSLLVGHVIFAVVFLLAIVGPIHPIVYYGNTLIGLGLFVVFGNRTTFGFGDDVWVTLAAVVGAAAVGFGLRVFFARQFDIPRPNVRKRLQRIGRDGGVPRGAKLVGDTVAEQLIWRATYQHALLGGGLYGALHTGIVYPFTFFQLYVRIRGGGRIGIAKGLLVEGLLVSITTALLFLLCRSIWPSIVFQLCNGIRVRPRLYNRFRRA